MAIEDAYTFAFFAGKLDCDFQRVQALYEKVRLERNNKVQSTSMMQGKLNHIKNPVGAFIRNLIIQYTPMISIRTKNIWGYDVDAEIMRVL